MKSLNRKIEGIGLILIFLTIGHQYLNSIYTQNLFWSANQKVHEKLNHIYDVATLDETDVNYNDKLQEIKNGWSPYYTDGSQVHNLIKVYHLISFKVYHLKETIIQGLKVSFFLRRSCFGLGVLWNEPVGRLEQDP